MFCDYALDSRLLAFNPFSPSFRMHLPFAMTVSNPIDSASARMSLSKLPGCNHTRCTPFFDASWRDFNVIWGGVRKLKDVDEGDSRSDMLFVTERDSIEEAVGLIGCTGRLWSMYHLKMMFPNFLGSWLAPEVKNVWKMQHTHDSKRLARKEFDEGFSCHDHKLQVSPRFLSASWRD